MEKVQVLLSYYNGEKYIQEQLNSILKQKEVEVSCLIRDDGSDEYARRLLEEIQDGRVRVVYGTNEGWKRGFYRLVFEADDVPFYAFADQDDVWMEWKLKRAVDKLNKLPQDKPCMYYSNVSVTDENLQIIGEKKNISPPGKKESSLHICYGQGCTMVFNRAAREVFMRYEIKEPISHECWMAILCIYFGSVVYDDCSSLLYRQHGDNSLGAKKKSRFNLLRQKLIERGKAAYFPYYRYLFEGYFDLLEDSDKQILSDFMNYKKDRKAKLRLLGNPEIKRYTVSGTLALKMAIVGNRV